MTNVTPISHPADLTPHMPALLHSRAVAVGVETTGCDPRTDEIRLLLLAADGLQTVLAVHHPAFRADGLDPVREVFSAGSVKIFHDANLQLQFLEKISVFPRTLFDTLLAARLLHMPGDPEDLGIEALAARYLHEDPEPAEERSRTGVSGDLRLRRAACRTEYLLRLREALIPRILNEGMAKTAEIEFRCVRAVAHMEYGGIHLDQPRWRALLETAAEARDSALKTLQPFLKQPVHVQNTLWGDAELIGPNFDSPAFVLNLLRDNGIPVEATARADLYPYRTHPLVNAISGYRRAAKSISSFLRPYLSLIHPATGRIHPRYGQLAVPSGRMSCSTPNIQQIPRSAAFRSCFRAPPGRSLILADYSQIELRVAAQISGDKRMLAAYRAGEDLHLLTASHLSGKPMHLVSKRERQEYKAVNLGLIYGMGAAGLRQTSQLSYGVDMPMEDAEKFRKRFFETYEGISEWHRSIRDRAEREGRTLTGRRFAFRENAGLPERSNTPVQGTAADIIKKALGLLAERIQGSGARIVAAVHDEILMECASAESDFMADTLKKAMEEAANSILPLVPTSVKAVVSESWAEK